MHLLNKSVQRLTIFLATSIAASMPNIAVTDTDVENLYPLDAGYRWTHKVVESSQGNRKTTLQVSRNLELTDIFGSSHTPQLLEDEELPKYVTFVRTDGSGVFSSGSALGDEPPKEWTERRYFIKFPVKVGTTWRFPSHTFLLSTNYPIEVESAIRRTGDSVSVGTSTFDNCIEISSSKLPSPRTSHISIDSVDLYCAGVGLVSTRYEEKSPEESGLLTIELVSLARP